MGGPNDEIIGTVPLFVFNTSATVVRDCVYLLAAFDEVNQHVWPSLALLCMCISYRRPHSHHSCDDGLGNVNVLSGIRWFQVLTTCFGFLLQVSPVLATPLGLATDVLGAAPCLSPSR